MAIGGLSTGLNSGLPIGDMVSAMVAAEKAPKEAQLARLEKTTTTRFSALGQLKSALNDFQTAMKDLNSAALFEKRSASSSNTTALTATATKTAAAGTYQIEVKNLATASKVATAAQASTFKTDDEQTLTIQLGEDDAGIDVKIAAGSDLASIRDQLNKALKDKGVTVNTISDPSTGKSRLVFSGKETGEGKDIIVTGKAGFDALDVDGRNSLTAPDGSSTDASKGAIVRASDAQFTIDGLLLKSATNKPADAISGVSFELLAKTEVDKPLTLTVGQDTTTAAANVKKFVDAYNKLITTSNTLTNVTKVGDESAPVVGGLVGDATVRSLLSNVRNELVNPSGNAGVSVLADLGITTQKNGTLKIDDAKLKDVLTENFDSVSKFLTGDTGLMSRVTKRISGFSETGGILEQRMSGLQGTLTDITKQKEALTLRVDKMQTRLLAQFNAMESLIGKLNGTSSQLGSALDNLPGVVRNK